MLQEMAARFPYEIAKRAARRAAPRCRRSRSRRLVHRSHQRHHHLSRYHPRLRGLEAMAVTRTHFRFRIDVWTANSESIVGHVAGIEDYEPRSRHFPPRLRALAPRALRHGARVGAHHISALYEYDLPLGARRRPDVVWTRSARIPVWGRRPQNAPAAATRIVRASTGVMAPPAVGASSAANRVVSRPASPDGKPVQNSTAMISSGNGRIFCGACGGAVTNRRGARQLTPQFGLRV